MGTVVFTKKLIGQCLARGYCHEPNRNKELDSDLIIAQVEEIYSFINNPTNVKS